jgi:hypothetical protein
MSGHDAIRGFVYQTIASVVHALVDSSWEYLTIEPATENEKIDMLWEDGAGLKKCQQVKSSINNFTKPEMLRWLEAMVGDVPDAKEYELVLIGTCSDAVNDFVKRVNNMESAELGSTLDPFADKIQIELMIFNPSMLQGHVQNEVSRFLSEQHLHPNHQTVVQVTGGLLYQFLQFAMFSTRASKAQWTEELLRWVTSNYKRGLNLEVRQDRLAIGIYLRGDRKLVKTSNPFRLQLKKLIG